MPWVTNVPKEPLKWTLARASAEFQVSIPTLTTKLAQANQVSVADRSFTTRQLVEALFGSAYQERIAKCRAECEKTEVEVAILKGDYVDRYELEGLMAEVARSMVQIIQGSALEKASQDDLRRQLASIPVVLRNVSKAQSRRSRNGVDGDGSRPARDRSKRNELEPKKSRGPKLKPGSQGG